MATISPNIESLYRFSWTAFDAYGETLRKVSRIFNDPEALADMQDVISAFDEITQVGYRTVTASIEAVVTDFDLSAEVGVNAKVSEGLQLVFTRNHPANANIPVTNTFFIPGPVEAITDATTLRPVYTFPYPTTLASVTTNPDRLGFIIGYLEDNLIHEDTINNVITVGGWTYSPGRSVFVTKARIFDQIQGT